MFAQLFIHKFNQKQENMKKVISLFSLLFAMVLTSNAQSHCGAPSSSGSSCESGNSAVGYKANTSAPVIVIVNTASWCGVCKANAPKVEKDVLMKFMNDPHFSIVKNDLSNDQTKKASFEACSKLGVGEFAQESEYTGMIYFIDSTTKRIIESISVVKSDEEILAVFNKYIS